MGMRTVCVYNGAVNLEDVLGASIWTLAKAHLNPGLICTSRLRRLKMRRSRMHISGSNKWLIIDVLNIGIRDMQPGGAYQTLF
jgi:hypothetical protein